MKITNASRLKLLAPPLLAVVAAAVLLIGSSLVQTPDVAATGPFDRIEVGVGKNLQFFKVASIDFTCQSTGEMVAGVFKDHVKGAEAPGLNQDHEIWGANFSTECISGGPGSGVDITVDPVDPNNSIRIRECLFVNTATGANEDCTSNVSPSEGTPPGTQNFKVESKKVGGLVVDLDGELGDLPLETAQSSGHNAGVLAGTIAGIAALAVTLGGAAWYARRRWIS